MITMFVCWLQALTLGSLAAVAVIEHMDHKSETSQVPQPRLPKHASAASIDHEGPSVSAHPWCGSDLRCSIAAGVRQGELPFGRARAEVRDAGLLEQLCSCSLQRVLLITGPAFACGGANRCMFVLM
jgi:hypothetical protein